MKVGALIKEVFMLRGEEPGPDAVIMDMPEWDSMTHMAFIMRLEEESKVTFTGDEIAGMRTVADVERTLAAHKLTAG